MKRNKAYRKFLIGLACFFILLEVTSRAIEDTLLTYDTGDEIETVAKLGQVKKIHPSFVFVGSSRVAMSVNTDYLNSKYNLNSYNFSFSGANQWIMRNYIQWLLKEKPDVKSATFIIGIDPDSNFEDSNVSSNSGSNRVPKYLGLNQALFENDLDAQTFCSFLEEGITSKLYIIRFRFAWRNLIFTKVNEIFKKHIMPVVEKGRIANYMTIHGYDNGTTRLDATNVRKKIEENSIDTAYYKKRFARSAFSLSQEMDKELGVLNKLVVENHLNFYIYLPPVWISRYRTQKEVDDFYNIITEKLPTNKGFIDLSKVFDTRDSMFMDFQHLRHVGTFEVADSLYIHLVK